MMNFKVPSVIRKTLATAVAFASLGFATSIALAQPNDYPNKPIKLVVPFSAGGQTDLIARTMGIEMSKTLGQPVIIENKLGAAGAVAADAVAASPADGYTLCMCGSGPMIFLPLIDPTSKNYPVELPPVTLVYLSEYVLIGRSNLAANTAQELFADIKANPGKYTFGSSGVGGVQQLGMEMLAASLNSKMVHIPYKGEQPAAVDVAAGTLDLLMSTASNATPFLKAGKVKAYATSGLERNAEFPGLPTITSLGLPNFSVYTHGGFNAPKGTPQAVIDKLNAAAVSAIKSPAMQQRIKDYGLITPQLGAGAYSDYVRKETDKWGRVTKNLDFKRQ